MRQKRGFTSGRRLHHNRTSGGRYPLLPIEALERRQLLSAAALAAVPASIDPALAEQTLFAPGETRLVLGAPVQSKLLKFALDTKLITGQARFAFGPAVTPHPGDAALGLYDQDGNLLKKVDADAGDLLIDLYSRRQYIVGMFFGGSPAPEAYALELAAAPQVVNTTIAIDPATGLGASAGLSLEDSFNTPVDVDYYPLDLTNGGLTGSVTVTPTGLDVRVSAAVFRRADAASPWVRIASGSDAAGNPVVLQLSPPANGTLSDGEYLLSVAPLGFNTPARSYSVGVAVADLIGPASASGVVATELLTLPPTDLGEAGISLPDVLAAGGGKYFRFRAPAGPVTVSVGTGAFDPAISIFDSSGMLLDVSTRIGGGTAIWSLPEVDDEVLVVFVSDVGDNGGGTFGLTITGTYEPADVAIGSPYSSVGPIALGADQPGSFLRVQPNFGSDLLLIETNATAEGKLRVVGEDFGWVEYTVPAGKKLFTIDITQAPGVYDIFVAGQNAGNVSLRIGQFDIPQTVAIGALTSTEVNLTGDTTSVVGAAGAFGNRRGMQFYQHINEPGASMLSVLGTSGSVPLLAHYIVDGSMLKLSSFALPNDGGLATISKDLGELKLHGLATYALNFDGGGNSQYGVTGPYLEAVGVGMVPDPPPPVPDQNPINGNPPVPPPDPANFYSWLKIRNVVLTKPYERDFWRTILPLNMIGNPVVRVTPNAGSPLTLDVDVYDEDMANPGTLTFVGQILNAPGAMGTLTISNYSARQGHRIHFHVRPTSGDIGDGMYTLEMQVETTNPHPYEATESEWNVGATKNVIFSFGQSETWKDVVQNQFGDGSRTASFTTSTAFQTGSIDVFRFWVQTPGPVVVRTVALSPTVNTNIKLYRALFDANGEIDKLVEMQDVPVSFDWLPADRSEVDAQVYVNNYDLMRYTTGSQAHYGLNGFGMYFAVVKNQEGSTGSYRIEVDAPDFPMLGAATTAATSFELAKSRETAYIDPLGSGSVQIKPQFTEGITDFVGYFPVQLPDYHGTSLSVASSFQYWDFDLFDVNGNELIGSETDHPTAIPYTSATFSVLSGPRTVYLRAREQSAITNANATLTISNNVFQPPGTGTEPPGLFPRSVVPRMILTDPFGDAQGTLRGSSTMFANGDVRAFAFVAAAGPLTVDVTPDVVGGVTLQWAVYVNNTLRAWDQTQVIGGAFNSDSLTTRLLLPEFREAGEEPVEPYETAPMHYVVVYVKAVSSPTAGGGGFKVAVDSASTRPQSTAPKISFDVLNAAPTAATVTTDGTKWMRLFVPAHASGGVDLLVSSADIGSSFYSYSLYDHTGAFITGGGVSPSIFGFASIDLPQAAGGSMYYLRVGVSADATASVGVGASTSLPKANGEKPAVTTADLNESIVRSVSPTPDGDFRYYVVQKPNPVSQPTLIQYESFWVDQGGVVTLTGSWATPGVYNSNTPNMTMAVYRIGITGGEFPQNNYTLVDYANDTNWNGDGRYTLSMYLDPGAYLLRVDSPLSNTTGGAVDYELPDYRVEEAVLDPNFGTNALVHLQSVDNAVTFTIDAFRTKFVHATAPVGTLGPFSAIGVLYSGGGDPQDYDARLSMLQLDSQGNYSYITRASGGDATLSPPAPDTATFVPASAIAEPGKDYWMVLNRRSLAGKAGLGVSFPVPVSGTPDLVVQSIELSPNDGETRVDVKVFNQGYAPTFLTHSLYEMTDTSKNPDVKTSAELLELPIAPLGSHAWVLPWLPIMPEDFVQFTADHDDTVEELNEENNKPVEPAYLWSVDPHRPSVTLSLRDPAMDGNSNPDVWGRYISDVNMLGEIVMTITDPDGDLFRGFSETPYYKPATSATGQYSAFGLKGQGTQTEYTHKNFNFGRLNPTGPDHPNVFRVQIRDEFGLLSDWAEKVIQVVPMPNWLAPDPDQISYNYDTHKYDIEFKNDVVRQEGTIDQITGTSIPFIGDKMNRFLIAIGAEGSVSLNPAQAVTMPLTAQAQILVLGATVLDEHWDGSAQPTDHFQIDTIVVIDPLTVNADQFNVTFRLVDLPLFNYKSPKIPLFAYGVPGVAAISANLSFSVDAWLNAALTVAIQTDPNDPLNVSRIGLAAPTFIMPTIQAGLTISGDVTFIGFDLASLYGSIFFGLNVGYGLPTTAPSFVPFLDFFNEAVIDITGTLSGEIGAEIIGIEIFTIDFPTVEIDFTAGADIQTASLPGLAESMLGQALAEAAQSLPGGNDPVGELNIHESPQIAIDPVTGEGMYVQVIDSDPGPGGRGVLNVATRQAGAWSGALTALPGTAHVTEPRVAFTNDGASSPAVVVYQAHNSQTPHLLTRNQYLGGQDIRYRYYDGVAWMPEQSLTSDGLYDSGHAMAFNDSGQGVLAWVRNRNASPIDDTGALDSARNEIVASFWDSSTHSWSAPVALTDDAVGDAAPAVYAADDGTMLVVWKRMTSSGEKLYYSRSKAGSWSAAAELGIAGMPPGEIGSLAVGGDAAGRISVVFAHRWTDPATLQVDSRLFARTTTVAGLNGTASLEEIAVDANFSQLRTTNAPDGTLVAYWQQSTGERNDIWAATLGSAGTWSAPFPLTASALIEQRPSLAMDANGAYALVYETFIPVVTPAGPLPDSEWNFPVPIPDLPPVEFDEPVPTPPLPIPVAGDVGSSGIQLLPELAFTREMIFPFMDKAAVGATAQAEATIVNRGKSGSEVAIETLDITGPEVVLSSWTIHLAPGSSYDIVHNFPVAAGARRYAFRVSPVGTGEAFSSADNMSSAILEGLPDIAVGSVGSFGIGGNAGVPTTISAQVTNLSSQPIGSFIVKFTYQDPTNPNSVAASFGQTTISLGAFETQTVNMPWTILAGSHVITVTADSGDVIDEATEFNNAGHLVITARPDAMAENVAGDIIHATLLTGKNNVQIGGTVRNIGKAPLTNVPVQLLWSLDNGPWVISRSLIIPTLAAGASVPVNFTGDGLAGNNDYRVVVDPTSKLPDRDRSNNFDGTSIIIQGLPDLMVDDFTLDKANPVQGQALNLTTTLFNLGIAKAQGIKVEVLARAVGGIVPVALGGQVIGEMVIDELAALDQIELVIPLDTRKLLGAYELVLVVDRPQDILEVTDLNNEVTKRVSFTSGGTLAEGTAGADTFYVRLDASAKNIEVFINVVGAPSGSPTFTVAYASSNPLTLVALGGNDRLVVDMVNGVPIGTGGLYFNADGGTDRIILLGTAGQQSMSLSDSAILVGGRVLSHAYVERIEIDGKGGGDTLAVNTVIPTELLAAQVFASLSLAGQSHLMVQQGGTNTIVTNALSMSAGSTLDLTDNAMIIQVQAGPAPGLPAATLEAVTDLIRSARNHPSGKWMGPGITTSMLSAQADGAGLGSLLNDLGGGQLLYTDFEGVPVNANSVIVRFTTEGDLDLSRKIDGDDYFLADVGFLKQNGLYIGGDVNYDEHTDGVDYFAIDLAYLRQNRGRIVRAEGAAEPALSPFSTAAPLSSAAASEPVLTGAVDDAEGLFATKEDVLA